MLASSPTMRSRWPRGRTVGVDRPAGPLLIAMVGTRIVDLERAMGRSSFTMKVAAIAEDKPPSGGMRR